MSLVVIACTTPDGLASNLAVGQPSARDRARNTYHRVTSAGSPAQEPGAEKTVIRSPLVMADGRIVTTDSEWRTIRRPQLVNDWLQILGKIAPNAADSVWFGDVTAAIVQQRTERKGYTAIDLDLPLEIDLYSRHLLLLPKGQGRGPFPVVIAWSSTNMAYSEPVEWWGDYLATHGYAVFTGRPFIGSYRQGTRRKQAADLVYARFGHWLPMGKMVHDVSRQIEYLRTVPEVDTKRIGFIGFSLSAKAALYVAAFNPDVKATVAIDPHIAINGGTNWYAPWYLDWQHAFDDINTPTHTVLSLLNPDAERPGFEHDHQELLALAAPKPFLLIGENQSEDRGGDSDDLQSWAYVNSAMEVYRLLGVPERLRFVSTNQGHSPTGEQIDDAWKGFLQYYLRDHPVQ